MDQTLEETPLNPMALMQSYVNDTSTMKIGDTERSLHVHNLCKSLSMAQAEYAIAKKDKKVDVKSINMKYNYADFTSIVRASRPALSKHGLSICQPSYFADGSVVVTTMMLHDSGQFMASTIRLKVTDADPKKIGSAFTYAKRYGYAGMTGVTCEDEDEDNDIEVAKAEKADKSEKNTTTEKSGKYTAIKTGGDVPVVPAASQKNTAKAVTTEPAQQPDQQPKAETATQQPQQPPAQPAEVPAYVAEARAFAKVAFGPDLMREISSGEIAAFLKGRSVADLTEDECKSFKFIVMQRGEILAMQSAGEQQIPF